MSYSNEHVNSWLTYSTEMYVLALQGTLFCICQFHDIYQSLANISQVPQLTWKSVGFPIPQKVGNWETNADPGKKLHCSVDIFRKIDLVHTSRIQISKNNSQSVTIEELEGQTSPPPNPHFGWRPFSQVVFVHKVILYFREQRFLISSQSSFQLEAIFAFKQ